MLVCITDDQDDLISRLSEEAGALVLDIARLGQASDLCLRDGHVQWIFDDKVLIQNTDDTFLINRVCSLDSNSFFNFGLKPIGAFIWTHLSAALPLFNGISLRTGEYSLCSGIPMLPLQWQTVAKLGSGIRSPEFVWPETPVATFQILSSMRFDPRSLYRGSSIASSTPSPSSFPPAQGQFSDTLLIAAFVDNRTAITTINGEKVPKNLESAISNLLNQLTHHWNFDFAELACTLGEDGELTFLELSPRLSFSKNLPALRSFVAQAFEELLTKRLLHPARPAHPP